MRKFGWLDDGRDLLVWGIGVTICFFLGLCAAVPALASQPAEEERYIVVLEESVDHPGGVARRHAENRGAELSHVYAAALKGYAASMSPQAAAAVGRDPSVAYVERDKRAFASAQAPSSGFRRISGLGNPTLDIDGKDDVQVNVDVAVLDSGIDYDHPDLRVVARTRCDTAEGDPPHDCIDGSGDDVDGHGTHVAGIVGAKDNGIGTVGVAPGARLWAVRVLDNEGTGWVSEIVAGVNWVTERSGQIEVANMSLGADAPSAAMRDAIDASVAKGVIYVVAAGNEQANADDYVPARFDNVITVSALTDFDGMSGSLRGYDACFDTGAEYPNAEVDDTLAWYSNYGAVVDMVAPGTCIESAYKNGGYAILSGSSQAAPHVAGAAAILASIRNPNNAADVQARRVELLAQGNGGWTQDWNGGNHDSEDSAKEPLLSIDNEAVFNVPHPGNVTGIGTTSNTASAMQLFAGNAGGQIWGKDYNPFVEPWGWQPWGTMTLPYNNSIPIVGSPAATSRSAASRDLFVRGNDNQLYYRNWDSQAGAWSSWFWIQGPNNSTINASPAVTSIPGVEGAMTVAVRGSNNQIYLKNYHPAPLGWSAWMGIGAPPGGAISSPAIAVHLYKYIHVVVRGGNGAIWDRSWNADTGTWSSWVSLGGTLASAPALTASRSGDEIYLVARGGDNAIWYRKGTFGWSPWASLGGVALGDPAATSRDEHGVDVFHIGTDSKVQHRRYVPATGTWTSWMRVDDECLPGAC